MPLIMKSSTFILLKIVIFYIELYQFTRYINYAPLKII